MQLQLLPGTLEIENNPGEILVWEKISAFLKGEEGILGYKMPSIGIIDKENIPSFILRTEKFGIILIDVVNFQIRKIDEQGDFWEAISGQDFYSRDIILSQFTEQAITQISKDKRLFDLRRRQLKISEIRSYIVFPYNTRKELDDIWQDIDEELGLINENISSDEIDYLLQEEICKEGYPISDEELDIVDSLFENTNRSQRKIRGEQNLESISDFIEASLQYTFKLDATQRQVAMQIPDGPQRIRGLAGTGKTVILSMKAALVHKDYPNYNILFVFNTQSMYNQIQDYISDYHVREKRQNPNWSKLEVLHAWGGRTTRDGLYYKTALRYGVTPKSFLDVRRQSDPLETIYSDLLEQVGHLLEPIYDVVLIDEAQDFSPALFETVFHLTKDPKRIIWAYDEFQTLKELKIKESDELFGKDIKGRPNISELDLQGEYQGGIPKDFVLPNSYRNPRIALMLAHGIGMGLYNNRDIIPIEDRSSWIARGYEVHHPGNKAKFESGDNIVVERPEEKSRNLLESLLKESGKSEKELVTLETFDNVQEELDRAAEQIDFFVHSQGIEPQEIVVINLTTKNAKKEFEYLRKALDIKGIKAITPGFIEKVDKFKESGFVTLSTTFRAKGNEANVIFILNSQSAINNPTYRGRNAFFVAVTRSRGWCYIYANGRKADGLKQEFDAVLNDYPQFKFEFPNMEEVKRRLALLSASESDKTKNADANIDEILEDDLLRSLLLEKLLRDNKIGEGLKEQISKELQDKNED